MADQDPPSDTEDLFASPSSKAAKRSSRPQDHDGRPKTPKTPKTPTAGGGQQSSSSPGADREAALRRELDGVRQINTLISGVVSTLERARGNMSTVSQTVTTASTLLNTWTRILSQTEHNQRLLLNPGWKGATRDVAEAESENMARQVAERRAAAEENRRRTEAAQRKEEEERARELSGMAPARGGATRGTRGRGRTVRGATRGASRGGTAGSNTGSSSTAGGRGASGIGRGFGSVRGRARGA